MLKFIEGVYQAFAWLIQSKNIFFCHFVCFAWIDWFWGYKFCCSVFLRKYKNDHDFVSYLRNNLPSGWWANFLPVRFNPLPGEPLAIVHSKGESLADSDVEIFETAIGKWRSWCRKEHVSTWLKAHIYTILEPLFGLISEEEQPEIVRNICLKLFAGVGIIPRGEIEDLIAQLDTDMRKMLRDKKGSFGAFCWCLFLIWTSLLLFVCAGCCGVCLMTRRCCSCSQGRVNVGCGWCDDCQPWFYRYNWLSTLWLRVIRIDMLDRVINAVCDGAKAESFRLSIVWLNGWVADCRFIRHSGGDGA